MLHYQVVRTSPGGDTLSNKMNNTVHYRHVRHTLALMCAKNHLLIFSSFLDVWENVEWPRFFLDHPVYTLYIGIYLQSFLLCSTFQFFFIFLLILIWFVIEQLVDNFLQGAFCSNLY